MSMHEPGSREVEREERALPSNLRRDQPLVPVDSVAGRALMAVIAILIVLVSAVQIAGDITVRRLKAR